MIVAGHEYHQDRAARFARHAIEVASNRDTTRPAYDLLDRLLREFEREVTGPHPADDEAVRRTVRKVCGL